ncbi:MAG: AgmX/PglI C-terminal domain-containing protein [Archangium sp.]|nr:AgmX/PglI C-terminal domain-containing protein [Archangium sp.]
MRVIRLLMLGVLVVFTTLSFELAWNAAQDTGDLLSRQDPSVTDYVVSVSLAAVNAVPGESLDELEAWEHWVVEAPPVDPEPEPTPTVTRRRIKRPVAKAEPSALVAPEDAIRMVLRRKRAAFEHCYEQELRKQASFDGFVVVSMSVAADGSVTDVRVEEASRRDAVVGACIVAQLRQLKLPPLTEEADLLIPIRLQAKKPT